MKQLFHKLSKISLICVYIIIIAGAVVRMTGSGMGCPDWPKCFGYYIPPTQLSDIQFKPDHSYKKGHVIQVNDLFYYAKEDFTTQQQLNLNNWQKNIQHEYNSFNATHTWIEFINRLFTALAGMPILLLLIIACIGYAKKQISIQLLISSFLVILGMGFEAWLGKTVVDSNLLPYKISIHMIGSFFIIAMLLYCIYFSDPSKKAFNSSSKLFNRLLVISLLLTLLQVYLGTQVRQFVDIQDTLGMNENQWLSQPNLTFYIHRSVSIAIVLLNFALWFWASKKGIPNRILKLVLWFIGAEIITGMVIYYFHFPFATQPLHLVLAALLFGLQFYLILQFFFSVKKTH